MNTAKTSTQSQLFNRILKIENVTDDAGTAREPINKYTMITKVTVRPNPFHTVLTMDVTCESNRNIIVRMFSEAGKIVKMFSWYLVRGTNVTAINELGSLSAGTYVLDIIDNEGAVLFSSRITKE